MVYEWKNGARVRADAQSVGEELEQIEARDAETVVAAAEESSGALHDCFEWDDTAAAHEYRLTQARLILRAIVVVESPEDPNDEPIRYRAFEAIDISGDDEEAPRAKVYVSTREALSDPEMREQIMGRLEGTIREAEATASQYVSLVPAFRVTREKLREALVSVRAE